MCPAYSYKIIDLAGLLSCRLSQLPIRLPAATRLVMVRINLRNPDAELGLPTSTVSVH